MINLVVKSGVSRFWLLIFFWSAWPGSMFLVGFIGESRLIPIGKAQPKKIMPGGLAFGPVVLAILEMYGKTGVLPLVELAWWWLIVVLGSALFTLWRRRKDRAKYRKCLGKKVGSKYIRLLKSPTKIIHDVFNYYLMPTLLVGLGGPQLYAALKLKGVFAATQTAWLATALCLAFYAVWFIYDARHPLSTEDVLKCYVYEWEPFWKTQTCEDIVCHLYRWFRKLRW